MSHIKKDPKKQNMSWTDELKIITIQVFDYAD